MFQSSFTTKFNMQTSQRPVFEALSRNEFHCLRHLVCPGAIQGVFLPAVMASHKTAVFEIALVLQFNSLSELELYPKGAGQVPLNSVPTAALHESFI
jgi:hypothetical protein